MPNSQAKFSGGGDGAVSCTGASLARVLTTRTLDRPREIPLTRADDAGVLRDLDDDVTSTPILLADSADIFYPQTKIRYVTTRIVEPIPEVDEDYRAMLPIPV